MSGFEVRSIESAPEAARPILSEAEKRYGFVPNLLGILAEAPAALEGYVTLAGIFEKTSLSAAERQVVLLAASTENGCDYCMAAHSMLAAQAGVPQEAVAAIRAGREVSDARLEALRKFTARAVAERGRITESDIEAFLAAGFTRQQVLEVILGIAVKTLSNYTNHIAKTPIDSAFAAGAAASATTS